MFWKRTILNKGKVNKSWLIYEKMASKGIVVKKEIERRERGLRDEEIQTDSIKFLHLPRKKQMHDQ